MAALDPLAPGRRHPGDEWRDLGQRRRGHGPDPHLLPAAQGGRLDDGHPGGARIARLDAGRDRGPPGHRSHASDGAGARGLRGHGLGRALRQGRLHPMRVLVTGAGSGIGEAIADALHRRGDDLVLLGRNEQRAEDLRGRYAGADVRVGDLSEPATVADVVADVDRLDAVVHAAGMLELGPVADVRLEDLTGQLQVNLVAPTELTRALLPALRAARGTVVFLNSGAGLVAHPEWSAYAASKFGLRAVADSP